MSSESRNRLDEIGNVKGESQSNQIEKLIQEIRIDLGNVKGESQSNQIEKWIQEVRIDLLKSVMWKAKASQIKFSRIQGVSIDFDSEARIEEASDHARGTA